MKRREVLALLLSAVAWPGVGRAQDSWSIGFLSSGSPYEWVTFVAAFRQGLEEMGYSDGRNIKIEFRWAFGNSDEDLAYARELVGRGVHAIVASGGNAPAYASLAATTKIPIVATFGDDPVRAKFVASLDRPGGNITGVSLLAQEIDSKCVQLIRQLVSGAKAIGYISDPQIPISVYRARRFEDLTRELGVKGVVLPAREDAEIDDVVAKFVSLGVDALFIASTARFTDRRDRLVALTARYKLPTVYTARAYVDAGGLMSYGVDRIELYRQLGHYTGRVLRGGKPAEMPVLQPSKFELVVNMKTAKALGLTVPQSLLTLADALVQ